MEQLQDFGLSPMTALGATLLRFILAGFWIAHWWFKVGHRGMAATAQVNKPRCSRRAGANIGVLARKHLATIEHKAIA